ncbi:AraC family transcriptional regulator [Gordonia sp. FQ]|uniref:AraC family transcriptional regulator n=1 Tax=Gordonia sp. FQ TaxID=3446634 RepID=UPI003F8291B4
MTESVLGDVERASRTLGVDQFQAQAAGLLTAHRIAVAGREGPHEFRGVVQVAQVADIQVIYLEQGIAVDVEITEPIDYYDVIVAMRGTSRISAGGGGSLIDAGHGAVLSPGMRASMQMDDDYGQLHLRIEQRTLDRHLESVLGRPVGAPAGFAVPMDLRSGPLRSWRHLADMVYGDLAAGDGLAAHPLAARSWRDHMLTGLVAAQPGSYLRALDDAAHERPHRRALARALEYCEERIAEPIGVDDLAAHAGVSRRSLQRMFAEELAVSPAGYLQRLRLRRVRADLLDGDPAATVTDVALRWGFAHLSRFAAAYREQYGELPSQTLRRR